MASHTLTIFGEDYNTKWSYRFRATNIIRSEIKSFSEKENTFERWHEKVIKEIEKVYGIKLNHGQAQKWLNMTIKYIFVLKEILSTEDSRLKDIQGFLDNTDENDYYPPIDSYVIKGAKVSSEKPWSKMTSDDYNKIITSLGEGKNFIWEMESWGEFAKKYKEYTKDSYEAYISNKRNREGQVKE